MNDLVCRKAELNTEFNIGYFLEAYEENRICSKLSMTKMKNNFVDVAGTIAYMPF